MDVEAVVVNAVFENIVVKIAEVVDAVSHDSSPLPSESLDVSKRQFILYTNNVVEDSAMYVVIKTHHFNAWGAVQLSNSAYLITYL
jgi:hypothetical protein